MLDFTHVTHIETPAGEVISRIVGYPGSDTVDFNQLINHGDFDAITGWSAYGNRGSFSVSDNVLTYNKTTTGIDSFNRSPKNYVIGHKYFATVDIKTSADIPVTISVRPAYLTGVSLTEQVQVTAGVWTNISGITEYTFAYNYFAVNVGTSGNQLSIGDSFQLKNAMLIDLTQMFGAGNEPETVEELRKLFPFSYYPYIDSETKPLPVVLWEEQE